MDARRPAFRTTQNGLRLRIGASLLSLVLFSMAVAAFRPGV